MTRAVTVLGVVCAALSPLAAPALAAPAPESLRGAVLDSAGHPVAGALVTLIELARHLEVSADGSFLFADVPSGRYTLVVQRVGYGPDARQITVPSRAITVVLRVSPWQLEPITVTATRNAIAPLASPLPATALGGERLRQDNAVSLAQALDGLTGVRTLATGEQVGKPMIRGLTGPRVLILDNGLRLEDYSWSDEDGPSVDSRLAQRIEVIRGPASVLYGSDAIGGVINVLPDALPDARGRPGFASAGAEVYGGTNNAELGGVLRAEGAQGSVGWRVTGIGRRASDFHTPAGNPATPDGDLFDTGFHAANGEAVIGVQGARSSATLRYERYGGDFGLLDGPPAPDDELHGPLRRLSDDRVQATTNWVLGGVRLETRSQWQRHSLEEVVGASRAGLAPPIFDLLLNTYTTDVIAHHTQGSWLSGAIGASGLYQDNGSTGQVPLVPAARTSGGAVFGFEEAALGRWSLLAGLRGDVRHLAADSTPGLALGPQTRNTAAASGDLGVVYRPAHGLAIAANVGRAFRAPTLYELFTNGPHLGEDRYEIGLPSAVPEVSLNTDVSVRWELGRFQGEVAGYRNQIDHYLYVQPTGDTTQFVDPDAGDTLALPNYRFLQTARAVLAGMDVTAEVAALPVLTLRARFDFVNGTNDATHAPLPLMPPPRADLEAEFRPLHVAWAERVYLLGGAELVASQNRLGPFDTATPGYTLLHLGAGLSREFAGRPLDIDVCAQNLADVRYTDFLSRYKAFAYGEGRNVVIRVSSGL